MTSKFTNASFINYATFEELEREYQAAILERRRENIRNIIAGIITFAVIGVIVYFS